MTYGRPVEHGIIHVEDTKNDQRRDVPMSSLVRATLRAQPRHIRSDYVFAKRSGDPIGRVDKGMRGACSRAEIKDVVFHTLRHTFASRLVMSGVGIETVGRLLGHSSLAMVQRYTHLSPAHRAQAIAVLDSGAFRHAGEHKVNTSGNTASGSPEE